MVVDTFNFKIIDQIRPSILSIEIQLFTYLWIFDQADISMDVLICGLYKMNNSNY